MVAPTSVADLLELVRQSLPLDPVKLDAYVGRLHRATALPGKAGDLAALLVRDGFLTPFQADHLMRGRRPKFIIGKYLILDRIGVGGMGAVYLCEHLQMDRSVALKVLPADQAEDAASLARFQREAQAVGALNHPNIVQAFDVDVEGRTWFLVMEYVDGVNLQDLTAKLGRLAPTRAAHYVRQAADGLQHAHQNGLIHRDVKPANLLLSRAGVVKVLDLGLARFFHAGADSITREHADQAILGTADYLSPEQARDSHAVDIRADIYSLGATFYFLLTGRPPFADGTLNQKLIWHQMKAPTPVRKLRPEVPEAMAAVVERMLAKDAAGRHQTPAEVAAAVAPWTRTALSPPPASEMPPPRQAARAGKPWRKMAAPGGSAVVQRAARPTAVEGLSSAHAMPPVTPTRVIIPNLELPPVPAPPAAPVAPAVAAPPPAVPLAPAADTDNWSLLFDDTAHPGAPPAHGSARRRGGERSEFQWRSYQWHLVGAGAALLLLGGGVWLVLALSAGVHKPAAPPPAAGRAAPEASSGPDHLRAAAKGADVIELTWADPHGPSDHFRIERSTDRWFSAKNTAVAAVVAGNVTRYTDAGWKPGQACYYRVRAVRGGAESGVSNVAWPPPDYAQGFTPAGLVLNRGAAVVDKALRLTDANCNETRSAFYQAEVDIRAFTTRFRFRISPGKTADGFTFCIQGGDPTAVGDPAGGLGYESIPNSAAVKFDLWDNDHEGPNSTGLFFNGDKPTNPGAIDLTRAGIDLHGGRAYDAAIDYKDKKLTLKIVDAEDKAKTFSHAFDVDLPAEVGGPRAYVGFTAATGGAVAVQDILSWTWASAEGPE